MKLDKAQEVLNDLTTLGFSVSLRPAPDDLGPQLAGEHGNYIVSFSAGKPLTSAALQGLAEVIAKHEQTGIAWKLLEGDVS
jgi:hypothetical protein